MRADPPPSREDALGRLSSERFDVLVIGAGIIGARVAYEAARAGLKTALVDAGDFGGATSSASGKLIHGGMRYMRAGDLRLVREARREQRILAGRVAPHLVRPLPMVLKMGGQGSLGTAKLASALFAYKALDDFRKPAPGLISRREAVKLIPRLRMDGTFGLLHEARTDDARLTLATVKAASRAGAVVANHVRAVGFERSEGRISGALLRGREGEGFITARCRAVVNASGPWIDHLRMLEDSGSHPLTRLSKGVHLVLPLESEWRAAAALYFGGARTVYAVPMHGMLLLGTTDTPYKGDPGEASPEPADVASLLEAASQLLPAEMVREELVRHSFAGLRVLPSGNEETVRASREHVLSVGSGGMVSVGGGKLTTHRLIAMDALRCLPYDLRPKKLRPDDDPLPGAGPVDAATLHKHLDAKTVEHLIRLHGAEATRLLHYTESHPDALERIHPDAPDIRAQAHHAVAEEWAITPEDVLHRTTLGIRGLASAGFDLLSPARGSA